MTGLVVVGRRRGRAQGGPRYGTGRRRRKVRRPNGRPGLESERIVTRLDTALGRCRPGGDRPSVLRAALDVDGLLDLRVPDIEAEGAGQHGIGEVEGQVGEPHEQQPARAHALV